MSYVGYTSGMTTPKEHLGRVLRRARKQRGLLQEDVARELKVNVRQVGRWEKGENAPSSIILMQMLRLFREHADLPDLQELAKVIGETDPPGDLDARIADIAQRLKIDPWLADRIERVLSLTSEEYRAMIKYLDDDRRSTP